MQDRSVPNWEIVWISVRKMHIGSVISMISRCMNMISEEKKMIFTHNPFSMPQGGLEALETMNPEEYSGIPVRYRLQRCGTFLRSSQKPRYEDHGKGIRNCRVYRREI